MIHAKAIVLSVSTTRTREGSKTTVVVNILDGDHEGTTWNLAGEAEVDAIIDVKFLPDDQFCYLVPTGQQQIACAFEKHNFIHTMTGGSCTAFIRVLPYGASVWVTLADKDNEPDPHVPSALSDRIWVGTYANEEAETPCNLWIGTVEDYLAKLMNEV